MITDEICSQLENELEFSTIRFRVYNNKGNMGLISLQQFYSLLIQLTRLPSFWNVWNEYFREHDLVGTSYCKENVPCGGKNKCPKIWEIKEVCHTQKFLQ